MKSAKKSTPNSACNFDEEIDGMRVELQRVLLCKNSQTILLREDQMSNLHKDNIISVSDPRPEDIPKGEEYPKAPARGDNETDEAFDAKITSWETGKQTWQEKQDALAPYKQVGIWVPIYHVTAAKIDGLHFRVYHTVRGPMVGLVLSEDSNRVTLYSPAYVDPNLQVGRIHYLPIAFAGYQIILHKPCFGEGVPDQPVCLGYPAFVKQNQKGDYVFRSKGAYHHIETDIAADAATVSIDRGVRSLLEGALVTTDTRQPKEVAQARALKQLQAAKDASVTPTNP